MAKKKKKWTKDKLIKKISKKNIEYRWEKNKMVTSLTNEVFDENKEFTINPVVKKMLYN